MADVSPPEGFQPLEDEEIWHVQPHTSLYLGSHPVPRVGTLVVSTRRLTVIGTGASTLVEYEYPSISLHAICTDPSAFPQPCIYLQLHAGDGEGPETGIAPFVRAEGMEADPGSGNGVITADEAPASAVDEARLVPLDASSLQVIFEAMSECSALYPDDSEGSDDEPDEDAGWVADGEALGAEQQAVLDRFDAMLRMPATVPPPESGPGQAVDMDTAGDRTGRFDDADEDDPALDSRTRES